MSTYVLIHGGAHRGSCWDLLAVELVARGHQVVAPDLPIEDDEAGLDDHARVVVDAIGDRADLVVVGHSLGGLVAPIVCTQVEADLLVLLAAMVPAPGESCFEMWEHTGYEVEVAGAKVTEETAAASSSPSADVSDTLPEDAAIAHFYHDVPRAIALDAVSKLRGQSYSTMTEPSPLRAWPEVPTGYILCRDDRIVPPEWSRQIVADRLGIEPDEIDGSHSPFLSRPAELAELLESMRVRLVT